ncbi:MAG TPA: glycosyl transferase, partial [Streptosporangiaceae bacterium]|nr:glycosyl transferase [Streptosporangiaceae bacterium]
MAGGEVRRVRVNPAHAVAAGYLAGALLVTWRLWADPASRAVAGNVSDANLIAWFFRYAATAVAHGRLPALTTTALNAPQGVNLMWNASMLLPGVVLAPVTLAFGPQVSLTLMTTLGFAGSAGALCYVLRRRGVSVAAAALAGAVYGFSPALLQSAIGHYNLQFA